MVNYAYNGDDQRVGQGSGGALTGELYAGASAGSPLLLNGTGTYTPGVSQHTTGGSAYFAPDALGSTRGITGGTGAATAVLHYDAFGETLTRSGSTATPMQFAGTSGYQADATTGLLLLGHRYYDASIGRFLSSDPAQAGSNWYAYCDNNPLVRVDVSGLDWLQNGANFFGGWGNSLTGGLTGGVTQWINHQLGNGDGPGYDTGSGAYKAGKVVGAIQAIAIAVLDDGATADDPAAGDGGDEGGGDNRNCFVAGTMVWLANGRRVPIQEVRVGEHVLTRSPAAKTATLAARNRLASSQVVQLFQHLRHTIALKFSDGERFVTTTGHRFFVAGLGFVPAGRLPLGCQIITRAGPAVRLESRHATGRVQPVYNFEVAGTHTYFIGRSGLWVHNDCAPDKGRTGRQGSGSGLPSTAGPPNGSLSNDLGNGKGTIREYGPDGRAQTDYDFGHDHDHVGDPHAHDWGPDETGKWSRGRHRLLLPGE